MIQLPGFFLSSTLSMFILIKSEAKYSWKLGRARAINLPFLFPKKSMVGIQRKHEKRMGDLCYNATYVRKWIKILLRNFGITPFKWQKWTFKHQSVIATFISLTSNVTCRPIFARLAYPFDTPTLGILSLQHLLKLELS